MNQNQIVSLENVSAALIPALMAVATAFGWHSFSPAMQAASVAVTLFALSAVGVGLSWMHSWRTSNYQPAQVAAGLSTGLNVVVAFGAAFGVFHVSATQQAALVGLFGALAVAAGLVLAYVRTSVKVAAIKAAQ